ncbi:MAG: TIGR00730 family Rossman fold protein [Armatimonadetes bacterium]|nr:TIGR00730 family Rossman fold protein [Armatimonadota bacterium]
MPEASGHQPLAYMMGDFLHSPDGRPLRLLAEYLEPLRRFRRQRIQDTVVFFGSARILSTQVANQQLDDLAGKIKSNPTDDLHAQHKRAQKAAEWSRYYEDARELARLHTTWARSLKAPRDRFVVCSGGGPGIMEAANRGAAEAGGKTIGLNIFLPFEQGSNPYITPELNFTFRYFFMRKFWFAYLAKAMVVFPGGLGTLDETFEMLTLVQTKKLSKQIEVLLYGSEYWNPIINFQPLVDWGAISEDDLKLFTFVNSPQEAFEELKRRLEPQIQSRHAQENRAPGIARTRNAPLRKPEV